jgi:mono/diheme cytochrome c family protein
MRITFALGVLACAALLGTGCARGGGGSGESTSAPAAGAAAAGDPAHGKSIFAANCASCHGSTGTEGGIGPSLKNERSRKNLEQAIAWIKNPQPPMPKLYPSPLGDKDVLDVAAYVQSL